MRISGGKHRGRTLVAPKGKEVRPTSDKVRQAVFNILNKYGGVDGALVLDVFCGTGSLGLEALSRGAALCTFIDKSPDSVATARRNAAELDEIEQCHFVTRDAQRLLKNTGGLFDLVFLDPPYRKNLIVPVLKALATHDWLHQDALCVVECEKSYLSVMPDGFTMLEERSYGDTKILFIRYG